MILGFLKYFRRATGTYVSCTFDRKTIQALRKWAIDNKIPERLSSSKFHVTVMYSRRKINLSDELEG